MNIKKAITNHVHAAQHELDSCTCRSHQSAKAIFSVKLPLKMVLLCSLLVYSKAWAGNYEVRIQAPESVRPMLEKYLDIVRYQSRDDISAENLEFIIDKTPAEAAALLTTQGYFQSKIKVINAQSQAEIKAFDNLNVAIEEERGFFDRILGPSDEKIADRKKDPLTPNDSVTQTGSSTGSKSISNVLVVVELGEQVKVKSASLSVEGTIKTQSPERTSGLEFDWSLQEDEAFTQDDWSNAKTFLLRKVRSEAYAAAHFDDTKAIIDVASNSATLNAKLNSGPYFTMGEVEVSGLSRYPESIVKNKSLFKVGETYSLQKILDYQKKLQTLPYFSSVLVSTSDDPKDAQLVPIRVRVLELPTQRFNSEIGYGTDGGFRTNVQYSHLNIKNKGWIFDSKLSIEQKIREGEVSLTFPENKHHFTTNVIAQIEQDRTSEVKQDTAQIGVHYFKDLEKSRISYDIDYYVTKLGSSYKRAFVPSLSWRMFDVDNRADPRAGYSLAASIGGASSALGSSSTFARTYAKGQYFMPFLQQDVLALKLEAGAVWTKDDVYDVPAVLLFNAGGSSSLRGFQYQSIGVETQVDGQTVTLPGQYLIIGSMEYTHWFNKTWGMAGFYDLGTVSNHLRNTSWNHGPGIGLRWRSPVGPMKFDMAYGIPRHRFSPHISVGLQF